MKTVISNQNNISLFVFNDDVLISLNENNLTIGPKDNPDSTVVDFNKHNASIVENVTPPTDWKNGIYKFENNNWVNISQELENQNNLLKATNVREIRNQLLKDSDWTQVVDTPELIKNKWATYRQTLRDVPAQAGFPHNVQWPNKPE